MKSKTIAERVYESLLEKILSGRLEPGSKVVIDRIARDFDVSLIPVREALARLNEHGVLKHSTHKGYQVTPTPSANEYAALFRARLAIEYGAMYVGFANITPRVLQRLKEINTRISAIDTNSSKADAFENFLTLNNAFHFELVSLAASQPLIKAYERVGYGPQIGRKMYKRGAPDKENNLEEHRQIIEAMESGQKAVALEQLENHIVSGMGRFLNTIGTRT